MSAKKRLILTIFFGYLGIVHFVDKKYLKGILYILTGGIFYIGWFYDIYVEYKKYKQSKSRLKESINSVETGNEAVEFIKSNQQQFKPAELSNEQSRNAYQEAKTLELTNDYVVVDTETTGFDCNDDRIIEISAIKYRNGKEVDTFSELVNPQREIPGAVTRVTGIRQEDVDDKPLIDEVLNRFIEFISDDVLVAHNAPFDYKMIICECYRNDIPVIKNRIIDTLTLAKRYYSKDDVENNKLETFKKFFNIDAKSHRALDDCITCNHLYRDVLKRINDSFDLSDDEIKAFKIVKEILEENNKDINSLRAVPNSRNCIEFFWISRFMTVKLNGKLRYVTFDDAKEDEYDLKEFELTKTAQSEKALFRIKITNPNDILKLKEIILNEYDKNFNYANQTKKYYLQKQLDDISLSFNPFTF